MSARSATALSQPVCLGLEDWNDHCACIGTLGANRFRGKSCLPAMRHRELALLQPGSVRDGIRRTGPGGCQCRLQGLFQFAGGRQTGSGTRCRLWNSMCIQAIRCKSAAHGIWRAENSQASNETMTPCRVAILRLHPGPCNSFTCCGLAGSLPWHRFRQRLAPVNGD